MTPLLVAGLVAALMTIPGQDIDDTRPQTPVSERVLMILVDDLNVSASDATRLRSLVESVRDHLVRSDDLIGIVSTGYSSIEIDLSYDRDHWRFSQALDKLKATGPALTRAMLLPPDAARQRHDVHVALATAGDVVRTLELVSGRRRALLYLTSGYAVTGEEVTKDFDELARAAARADVAIYPIDLRRWRTSPDPGPSPGLEDLATRTGGVTLRTLDDFARVLASPLPRSGRFSP